MPGLDEPSRLLATPVERAGGGSCSSSARPAQDRAETLASLRDELLIAGPVALLLATLAGYFLAGLSLRPVEAMRRRAAAISAETPGERLPVPPTGDELERLGETLNAMLARLEAALERERDFVADAGHELRTPLALLRTELELALRHAETATSCGRRSAPRREEVDRLAQLAEDLLLIARSDRGGLPLRTRAARRRRAARVGRQPVRVARRGSGATAAVAPGTATAVEGDRLRLEQALGNLVDNALRHGEGEVRLSAAGRGRVVELHVRDEGPGFPPEFLGRAFERFARPTGPRARRGRARPLDRRTIAEAHGGAPRRRTGRGRRRRLDRAAEWARSSGRARTGPQKASARA